METKYRRTCVYHIGYRLVFCTKYRKDVLTDRVSKTVKTIITAVAKEKGFETAEIETGTDHVHMFLSAPPHISISVLAKWIKGITARKLFVLNPELKNRLYRGHLWNPSFYVGTVGDVSEQTVRKYIESQKKKA